MIKVNTPLNFNAHNIFLPNRSTDKEFISDYTYTGIYPTYNTPYAKKYKPTLAYRQQYLMIIWFTQNTQDTSHSLTFFPHWWYTTLSSTQYIQTHLFITTFWPQIHYYLNSQEHISQKYTQQHYHRQIP